ncbi:MAG: hypothetical protein AB7T37_04945 [Dehalococcoidia bacterium]
MTTSAGQDRGCSDSQRYEIRLQGHLDLRWTHRMDGMAFALERDGTTTLTGSLPDQAALHGLLARIRDLGVPIVSIQRLSPEEEVGNS